MKTGAITIGTCIGAGLCLAADALHAEEAAAAAAPAAAALNSGDTAWVLLGAALVFLMTAPGLALFYGGLVRSKNILSVLMQCMMIMSLISIQWVLFGYSLAFAPGHGFLEGCLGSLDWFGLKGVAHDSGSAYAATIPHQAFMVFQMMFAVITPALIIGAFAERMRFGAFCVFSVLWATLVYDPVAHWVWSTDGFMSVLNAKAKPALDFAGGTVVHITAGMSALACALFLGKRKGYPDKISPPHNLPFAVIGAGLLWFGWFGFNAGSALGAGALAASAFVATHIGSAVAALTWAIMDWAVNKRPTMLGLITGAVAGLVSITPASGFVNVTGAIFIGIGAGIIPWIFVQVIKPIFGYDDSLDAFGVHGVGGIWGALATGIFATKAINSVGSGAWDGNWMQIAYQFKGVALTMIYAFAATYVLLLAVNFFSKLRANEKEETVGLDLTQHKEAAYTIID